MNTQSPNRLLRFIAAFTILILIGYFIIGLGFVAFNIFAFQDFIIWLGVLGGLASAVGLLSFFQKSSTKEDLQELQLSTLREIAESSRQLEALEEARTATENDINSLEIQKKQMEVSIRKASLSLFFQEQRKLYIQKIYDTLKSNNELTNNLKQLLDINAKLKALEDEISKDENVDLLLELIESAKQRSDDGRVTTSSLSMIDIIRDVIEIIPRFFFR